MHVTHALHGQWGNRKTYTVTEHPLIGGRVHNAILFVYIVCAALVAGLGALMFWHARLIARGARPSRTISGTRCNDCTFLSRAGETSIEHHINAETKRAWCTTGGRAFRNPYDFGWYQNWRLFLGIEEGSGRSVWRHVLLPSRHPPRGDGLGWEATTYSLDDAPMPTAAAAAATNPTS